MKKIIALLLAVTIMTSTATVWAQELQKYEKGDIRVINLSDSITEDSISEIKNSINAGVICKEDSTAEVETVITIEDISTSNARNILTEEANCYKVTIETSASGKEEGSNARKVVSDSGDKNGTVEATATLQMIWTDVLGMENVLNKVSGTLTVISGEVTSGKVRYGDGTRLAILWTEKNVGDDSSFSYSPNMTAFDPTADYEIAFKDAWFTLYLKVSSSVFQ